MGVMAMMGAMRDDSRPAARLPADRAQLGAGRRALAADGTGARARPARPRRAAARAARSRSPPAPPTSARSRPTRSRCAATRWAGGSRCTRRSRRPSGSRGSCSSATSPGIADAERARGAPRGRRGARRRDRGATASRRSPSGGRAQPLFAGPAAVAALARADRRATTRPGWPPRCAGSAPASCRRCGTASASSRCRSSCRGRARREVPRDRRAPRRGLPGRVAAAVPGRATRCRGRRPTTWRGA